MQGIFTHIPETNYVPREYGVAAILSFLFMVLMSLVSVLNLLYFHISTFRSMCAVPNMAVFCSYYYYYYYYFIIIICRRDSSKIFCGRLIFLLTKRNGPGKNPENNYHARSFSFLHRPAQNPSRLRLLNFK